MTKHRSYLREGSAHSTQRRVQAQGSRAGVWYAAEALRVRCVCAACRNTLHRVAVAASQVRALQLSVGHQGEWRRVSTAGHIVTQGSAAFLREGRRGSNAPTGAIPSPDTAAHAQSQLRAGEPAKQCVNTALGTLASMTRPHVRTRQAPTQYQVAQRREGSHSQEQNRSVYGMRRRRRRQGWSAGDGQGGGNVPR